MAAGPGWNKSLGVSGCVGSQHGSSHPCWWQQHWVLQARGVLAWSVLSSCNDSSCGLYLVRALPDPALTLILVSHAHISSGVKSHSSRQSSPENPPEQHGCLCLCDSHCQAEAFAVLWCCWVPSHSQAEQCLSTAPLISVHPDPSTKLRVYLPTLNSLHWWGTWIHRF